MENKDENEWREAPEAAILKAKVLVLIDDVVDLLYPAYVEHEQDARALAMQTLILMKDAGLRMIF